jgi:hypothetical protein
MSKSNKLVQDWYVHRLQEHFRQRYLGMLAQQEDAETAELGAEAVRIPREELDPLPQEVRDAHAYYHQHYSEADIGSARVYRVPAAGKTTYAVRVTTDGDDGYLEVYGERGGLLAAGRTYLELIAWGDREWLRAQALEPGELPPELQQTTWKTLWGKPVEGYHCMETCEHECRVSPPGRCAGAIGHVAANGSAHRCAYCGHEWGGVPRPPEVPPVLLPAPTGDDVKTWDVEAYFLDGGIYQKRLLVAEIPIATASGRRVVPVGQIQWMEFAARAPGESDVLHLAGETVSGRIEGEAIAMRDQWDACVRLDRLSKVIPMPPEMDDYAEQYGTQHEFTIWGRTDGTLFGSNPYTLHSCLATAAVHHGLLEEGEMGVVRVEIVKTPKKFKGSEKHDVESEEWDAEYTGGAFRFVKKKG